MNPIMLALIIAMVVYILYLQAVIAGMNNGLKCARMLHIKMCNKVFVECGISRTIELRREVENEVAKEMGLEK